MKHSLVETAIGALVIGVALVFLVFSYSVADVAEVEGMTLRADFTATGGLRAGDDVEISGVKVGTVGNIALDPETYQAQVYFTVRPGIAVPDDTAAVISSVSLLGGRFLSLEPGGSEVLLDEGGVITLTQSPQNLEQLLGKFIFSANAGKEEGTDSGESGVEPAETAAPAPSAEPSPETPPDASAP